MACTKCGKKRKSPSQNDIFSAQAQLAGQPHQVGNYTRLEFIGSGGIKHFNVGTISYQAGGPIKYVWVRNEHVSTFLKKVRGGERQFAYVQAPIEEKKVEEKVQEEEVEEEVFDTEFTAFIYDEAESEPFSFATLSGIGEKTDTILHDAGYNTKESVLAIDVEDFVSTLPEEYRARGYVIYNIIKESEER